MNKIRNYSKLVILIIVVVLILCDNTEDEKPIKKIISEVYGEQSPYRNETLASSLFTKDLYGLMLDAKQIEKQSIESIPERERSQIKPYMIEGEIFTSLYEGYTSYTIENITFKDDSCIVKIKFTNNLYEPQEIWTDEIILRYSVNKWYFDNVKYEDKYIKDLKSLLKDFIDNYENNKEKLIDR